LSVAAATDSPIGYLAGQMKWINGRDVDLNQTGSIDQY